MIFEVFASQNQDIQVRTKWLGNSPKIVYDIPLICEEHNNNANRQGSISCMRLPIKYLYIYQFTQHTMMMLGDGQTDAADDGDLRMKKWAAMAEDNQLH